MPKIVIKNWKTTTIGATLSITGYIAMFPSGFDTNLVNLSRYISLGGLSALGIAAKDADTRD